VFLLLMHLLGAADCVVASYVFVIRQIGHQTRIGRIYIGLLLYDMIYRGGPALRMTRPLSEQVSRSPLVVENAFMHERASCTQTHGHTDLRRGRDRH
jgi:hypothetical protein